MKRHNQNPNQLSKSYDRRRKAAAWAAGFSLFGGAVAVENVQVQSAVAAPEIARQAEQNPQSFINSFDERFVKEEKLMHSSPYYYSLIHKELSKKLHTVITIEYVGAPSKQYPGRYDWLAVLTRKGESVPLNASINLGGNSDKYTAVTNYKSGYDFAQIDDSNKFSPRSMEMVTDSGTGSTLPSIFYGVSSEGYPAPDFPSDTVKFSDNSAQVAAEFNSFLNQMHSITTRR